MTEKKNNRWLVNTVMILGLIAFLGFSVIPFIGVFQGNARQAETAATAQAKAEAQTSELEAQARGYELVLQREPDNLTALRGLLEIRLQLQNIEGAIAPLEKLAKLQPEEPRYGVLLAQAKQYTGDAEGAAQAYRAVLNTHPGDADALQGLVKLLLDQNRPEAAIGLLQDTLQLATQANQIKPGSIDTVSVHLILGQVYAEQKRLDEAIAAYDEGIKANDQDFRPVLAKAIVLREKAQTQEADTLFAKAVTLAPAQYKDQINQLARGETPGSGTANSTPAEASAPAGGTSGNTPGSLPAIAPPNDAPSSEGSSGESPAQN
ncbi:tetratricopeptide repeat protein [Trichothermofontia sp.]